MGALSEGNDHGVAHFPVDRKMKAPVVVVDCDDEPGVASASGGDPSSKSTVIKGVEPAFNEIRSESGIKSKASSKGSFK